eukprot:5471863-Alexandrium_andersonii.AAC.1
MLPVPANPSVLRNVQSLLAPPSLAQSPPEFDLWSSSALVQLQRPQIPGLCLNQNAQKHL